MGWGWSPLLYLFFWILVGASSLEVFWRAVSGMPGDTLSF